MSVVGEVAVVGSLPGDRGPGSTAHFTPEGDALAVVTRDVAQGHEELRGNWEGTGSEEAGFRTGAEGSSHKKRK